jgi:exopolyphosphatase/guanosine-5'-triphosphate,3'-diphosphate pyrophosphatase
VAFGQRLGIIDIGSNSVRLVIYETLGPTAQRVIEESKQSERLSSKVDPSGTIPIDQLGGLLDTLRYFQMVCDVHQVTRIRAVATAAIRNATNQQEILAHLNAQLSYPIEILSGHEEAFMGFVGVMNATNIQDGFVVDIGGGSTEISLFLNRELQHSFSFPFGAVNMAKQYVKNGDMSPQDVVTLSKFVETAISEQKWLRTKPDLPVVGLGGSFRSLAKINQRNKQYSFPLTHQYEMQVGEVEQILNLFIATPFEKRKKMNGLAKDRADIIVPGVIILRTILHHLRATKLIISGSGLRDGVYAHTINPAQPIFPNILEASVSNILANHEGVDLNHVNQVKQFVSVLFDAVNEQENQFSPRQKAILLAAASLYRIGISIDYYGFQKHTFYLVAFSRLFGLDHREKLMCALIASFKSKNQVYQLARPYRDILSNEDLDACVLLGNILQLAVALDRSETQPIASLSTYLERKMLLLAARTSHAASIEQRQVITIAPEFNKAWALMPTLIIQ